MQCEIIIPEIRFCSPLSDRCTHSVDPETLAENASLVCDWGLNDFVASEV